MKLISRVRCPKCMKLRLKVAAMYINGKYIKVCPVCALELRNKTHGLPSGTKFSGAIAQRYYDDEIIQESVNK